MPDLVMLLENAGSPVEGESPRKHPDGKPRLDIQGWSWGQMVNSVGGSADGSRNFAPLTVVRMADAASATLSSLAYNRSLKLTACISVFRAGGDPSAPDTGPMFEFRIEEGQLIGQYFVTGQSSGMLTEVLVFSYRKMVVNSAAQQKTGMRGAVRECLMAATGVS
ncbi:type VI secretion system tube protein Hcp [Diaphorobacter aerolatus]|uniref:Type VI secretion system tube protein Hcp n=1 Tax=Diaphorobacter aerolatus TaxID=1288495 RepID=A0A7H0GLK1_9BURK|nr:type VI secretion system tube protein Hcp [Diaphorobacter aerolatus]QNP49167.1 type VI secretion system tube protein Hcp [Diaphorobacter aerolatus]